MCSGCGWVEEGIEKFMPRCCFARRAAGLIGDDGARNVNEGDASSKKLRARAVWIPCADCQVYCYRLAESQGGGGGGGGREVIECGG